MNSSRSAEEKGNNLTNTVKPQLNSIETNNRYNKKLSKLMKLSKNIEYLKRLITSQSQNEQIKTESRINRKLNSFLKTKKRLISGSENKRACTSQNQQEVLKKRKSRSRKATQFSRPMPESCTVNKVQ